MSHRTTNPAWQQSTSYSEVLNQPLYDTLRVQKGFRGFLLFFQNPIGTDDPLHCADGSHDPGGAPSRDYDVTNLQLPGCLPSGQQMQIGRVDWHLTDLDRIGIDLQGFIRFNALSKFYRVEPLQQANRSVGAVYRVEPLQQANRSVGAGLIFDPTILLQPQCHFSVEVCLTRPAPYDCALRVNLTGLLLRAVV